MGVSGLAEIPISNLAMQHLTAQTELQRGMCCISAVTFKDLGDKFPLEGVPRRAQCSTALCVSRG